MTILLEAEAITKRYGNLVAVDEVSMRVESGEIYALVGSNGAGKSTLIRAITGIAAPDSGKVIILGEDLGNRDPETKRHIGYLPEELILYDQLTGHEYLQLVTGLKGGDPDRISEEIEVFELAAVARKLVGGYSLGMRKKLGLAAAMIGSPDVLILDEPLNGLDVEMMRKLRLRLETERDAGRAILVSSHVMSFVERVSDRVGVMRGGKLVAEGTPLELRKATGLGEVPFEDVFFELAG